MANEFEPGRRYDEKEVNVVVARFFTDHTGLRRALVDEGLLDRDHGEYWRARGWSETEGCSGGQPGPHRVVERP